MTPEEQARVFLAMVLCGAALGAVYDALLLLRRWLLRGRAWRSALDVLFGLLCAAGVIVAALRLRTEAFRWYVLLGTAAGMGLEQISLGVLLRRVLAFAARFGEKNIRKGVLPGSDAEKSSH